MLLGAGTDANAVDAVCAAMGGCAFVGVSVYGVLVVFVLSPDDYYGEGLGGCA